MRLTDPTAVPCGDCARGVKHTHEDRTYSVHQHVPGCTVAVEWQEGMTRDEAIDVAHVLTDLHPGRKAYVFHGSNVVPSAVVVS